MLIEDGLERIVQVLSTQGRSLSMVEVAILKGTWQGQSYAEIAEASNYSEAYLKRHV